MIQLLFRKKGTLVIAVALFFLVSGMISCGGDKAPTFDNPIMNSEDLSEEDLEKMYAEMQKANARAKRVQEFMLEKQKQEQEATGREQERAERKQRKRAETAKDHGYNCFTDGPKEARLTLVLFVHPGEFGEMHSIRRINETAQQFQKEMVCIMKVATYRFDKESHPAAKAVVAASRQGKEFPMFVHLQENHHRLHRYYYTHAAKELGLDVERFEQDMADPAIEATILANGQERARYKSPLIINGEKEVSLDPVFIRGLLEDLGKERKSADIESLGDDGVAEHSLKKQEVVVSDLPLGRLSTLPKRFGALHDTTDQKDVRPIPSVVKQVRRQLARNGLSNVVVVEEGNSIITTGMVSGPDAKRRLAVVVEGVAPAYRHIDRTRTQ
ncbi:MAG: hypothetical protein A3C80_03985 [Candidatus Ryanbacteria bacterium RIFCSPHIGHO2_02_FULL_45_43]|uniref:Thioredoxin-like fold domain-containing protein n=1 Tax=Candidatus Ryanbacteria bacterium RIFCSPHIGHO2_01_45_13 TaxID=1802112 RepID=A0A1G2FWU2_9BACT|nr:MAG: hypothetical protein A2718_00015 [Candidatus Ryanbacteria bacterium RIFCSPHIGHO2_01_FULL_44_130]OGZ42556.1 MAG: hypothetical protein A2W41_01645 [Candidatus Ryanbacteria bacterium RIFCSPHIGHO2_01_45_13]OGZ48195.1 MAG: hypothetical protein A3C80_03985 [Candidatus Ryanbacteria bacterium RIFCSPHIGHO2_02_FULL_45_43]OGZ49972.1 MAG: hypothetical protein A3E55_01645 [Candidatus Ryanbacteria bacterium RIFCSPHIGHO2_12_FULL_44_20]OGZ51430.1 MAG: hypothetical protein A3A17_01595 [Candidatus Ryanba